MTFITSQDDSALWGRQLSLFKLFVAGCFVPLFSACDNTVSHTSMTLDSNAYYGVYQKSPSDNWRVISHNNTNYSLKTVTFTLEDETTPYTLVFVCPSNRGDNPHEVYVYYATAKEMDLVDFKCRLADEDIIRKPVYGKVAGVSIADSQNSIGEIAHITLSKDVALNAHEAYAAIVASGRRDAVAYKGKQHENGLNAVEPEEFYIERGISLALTTEPQVIDLNFSEEKIGIHVARFATDSFSTIDILGLGDNEVVRSKLGFLSERKSYLLLKESTATQFNFLDVPLTLRKEEVTLEESNFHPGEGHELIIDVFDENGNEIKKFTKLFTVPNNKEQVVRLPATVSDIPTIKLNKKGDLQEIVVNWKAYQSNDMTAELYQWQITGIAAPYDEDEKPDIDVNEVKWSIIATKGWLERMSETTGNYTIKLPVDFDVVVNDRLGDLVYVWRKEWGFRENTPMEWELKAYAISDEGRSNDVVEYVMNRDFNKSFSFSQANIRGSAQP